MFYYVLDLQMVLQCLPLSLEREGFPLGPQVWGVKSSKPLTALWKKLLLALPWESVRVASIGIGLAGDTLLDLSEKGPFDIATAQKCFEDL